MKSRVKCFLSLIALLYLIGIVRASIVHRPDILSTAPRPENLRPDKTSTGTQIAGYGKFVLLTTGKQIKLYPLLADDRLSDDSFLVKFARLTSIQDLKNVIERSERKKSEEPTSKRDHDSILPKRFEKGDGLNEMNANGSILPNNDQLEEHGNGESYDLHGRSSWISDTNYFLEPTYCTLLNEPAKTNECLVIVWLDKGKGQIGLGAIDLRLNAIYANQSRTLWAQQLPYSYTFYCFDKRCLERSEIVIDERRKLLYINTAHSWSRHSIQAYKLAGPEQGGLAFSAVHQLSPCHRTTVTNLNLDDDSGDWLFYSGEQLNETNGQPIAGSQQLIAGFNLNASSLAGISLLKHAQVTEIARENQRRFGVSSAAPDAASHRFYWLSERNELFSCGYAGQLVKLEGQLPAKPVIRAPGRTQVFQGTFYFSDSKKRLISYKLPPATGEPSPISQSHRVLLIEEQNLENYRLLDLGSSSSHLEGEEKLARKRSPAVDAPGSGRRSFSSLQTLFEDLFRLVVSDDYVTLRSRADCSWESCIHGERSDSWSPIPLFAFVFVMVFLVRLCAEYIKGRFTFGSEERLVVSKDKCPV